MTCKKDSMPKTSVQRGGFTLIELSISILLISLIISTVMMAENQKIRVDKSAEYTRKQDMIAEALYRYRILNDRLPCPGDSSLTRTSAYFGLAANPALGSGDCSAGSSIRSNINPVTYMYGGSVPVRTLGLPDDVAFDPWGNYFTYYTYRGATIIHGFSRFNTSYVRLGTLGVSTQYLPTFSFKVEGLGTEKPVAIVLSHGLNGHGAFTSNGVRINSHVTNTHEQANCVCDEDGVQKLPSSLTFYSERALPTNTFNSRSNFDDQVRYYYPSYFMTPEEKQRL